MVKVLSPDDTARGQPGTVETSLGMTLGLDPNQLSLARLGDARENFFYLKRASFLVVEERYAFPYTSRGYKTEPFMADREVALYAPKGVTVKLPPALVKALDALR
jgi:hypothetical protein